MSLHHKQKTVWEVVPAALAYDARQNVVYMLPRFNAREASYQLARAQELLSRPMVLREVTLTIKKLKPMPSREMQKEKTKREHEIRTGKRKIRF